MRLLYCIPALHNTGGMERVIAIKANYLAEVENYEITIATTDHRSSQAIRYPLHPKIKLIHLDIDFESHFQFSLVSKTIEHYKKLRKYKKVLKQIIDENKIDICVSLCGKEIDFLGSLKVDCSKIAEIHFAINNRQQFLDARKKGFLWKWIGYYRTTQLISSVKNLDEFVVLTQEDEKQWRKYCNNVHRIPNPAQLTVISPAPLFNKKVIAVGRLSPQKGYDLLLQAWQIVMEKHPDWILEIYGDGELREKLEQKIIASNLSEDVKLLGNVSNIQEKYLESSIFVLSSIYEGLPMAMIEAMTCGLPIVAFDCEFGPRELITDGRNGFLVEPGNTRLLSEKIIKLIENPELRVECGKNATLKSKEFATEKIMKQWIALFENNIKRKAQP
jgi:glycosyltransferase involved in cell wall biosynthesis